ncbi:MAG: MaoC family dehydratase N-terminal domain-containing protein [Polaromonas sp.]|nr:MaoC family dehydratase N-terminal domain-containing protein [Polaromonas sp.]
MHRPDTDHATDTDIRTVDAATLAHLQSWVGRTETLHDQITASPWRGLSATLDRDEGEPGAGDVLPPLWHWLFFLPRPRQSDIGPDGHPRRGGFLPPVPLPRRMWAGGRLQWVQPGVQGLRLGDHITRTSRIESVTHKSGRSGDLLFVLVRHEIHNAHGLALTEAHDIVYRANPRSGDPVPPPQAAPGDAAFSRTITPDDVLLFRYSALTFNGHRIHYDRRYVTGVEGYPGLIVHGPLIATLLLELLRDQLPGAQVLQFQFRALKPVFDTGPFKVHGKPAADGKTVELWTEDSEGWLTMQATATLA